MMLGFPFVHLLLILSQACSYEVEVNAFGESSDHNSDLDDIFRSVNFANNYFNMSISIFWFDMNTKNGVYMFDLKAGHTDIMRSTDGHVFFATKSGDNEINRLHPNSITIISGLNDYYFGPQRPATRRTHSHPSVRIIGERTQAMSAKFRSLVPSADYYYDDGRGGTFQGTLPLRKESTINTYEGHVFFFTESGNKDNVIARFTMDKNRVLYLVQDDRYPAPHDMIELVQKEESFRREYFNRTGIMWRHYFGPDGPRPPPVLYMWPTGAVGDVHKVASAESYWSCDGSAQNCQGEDPLHLELEVVSTTPRVFIIENFLSDFEADKIKAYAEPLMKESTVGNRDGGGARRDSTRTSRNAWVSRETSPITDTLFRRAANVLNVDEAILRSSANAEDMQVVHYVKSQKYDSHHDWGVSGYPESRIITLLLYLTDQPTPRSGGETAFPKGADGVGFKVAPKKGCAVLFYNLLEDGNGDDLALHAALPVNSGEKWLANFWVWDPKRR